MFSWSFACIFNFFLIPAVISGYSAAHCLAPYVFGFYRFFFFFLFSNLIALSSEKMLDVISVVSDFSRLDL